MMNRKLLIVAGVAALVLAITNPSNGDFMDWAKDQINHKTKNDGVRMLANIFAAPMISATTSRTNCLLFSVFTTKLSQDNQARTVGILKLFIPLDSNSPFNGN